MVKLQTKVCVFPLVANFFFFFAGTAIMFLSNFLFDKNNCMCKKKVHTLIKAIKIKDYVLKANSLILYSLLESCNAVIFLIDLSF
jgi:hypothetical protein